MSSRETLKPKRFTPLSSGGVLQRKCACGQHTVAGGECSECEKSKGAMRRETARGEAVDHVPPIVNEVQRTSGQLLDSQTRAFMEQRFSHDFSQVRVHTDSAAGESARAVDAMAYTVGQNIAFAPGTYQPSSPGGLRLLAHELTHVVQQQGSPPVQQVQAFDRDDSPTEQEADRMADRVVSASAPFQFQPVGLSASPGTIQAYRDKKAFNFGKNDTADLKEETFKDPKTQPFVERIKINFDSTKTDTSGALVPIGTLTASYHDKKKPDIVLSITGGSVTIGLSDQGKDFTISRIEGIGYNDLPLSADKGEGPNRKYAKNLSSSMSYAMFFKGKQAIHIGSLDIGSHACVHGGDDTSAWDKMQQLNYHSVEGRTKVDVQYEESALKKLCCARMVHLGVKKKGGAPNPCNRADPKDC